MTTNKVERAYTPGQRVRSRVYTFRILLLATAVVLAGKTLVAQGGLPAGPPSPYGSTPLFVPLTLPLESSATRLAAGAPGLKSWQTRADNIWTVK